MSWRWVHFLSIGIVFCISMTSFDLHAARVDTRSCSKAERTQILNALRWLKSQKKALKDRLGTDGLAQFEGRSHARWTRLLGSGGPLIKCRRDKACEGKVHRIPFGDITLPVRHTVPIQLCTSHLHEAGHYAVALAHEMGHLVWVNADQRDCTKRCNQPRLSQSLALLAYHLWTGTAYDRMACLNACMPGFVPDPPSTAEGQGMAPDENVPAPARPAVPPSQDD